MSQVYVQVVHEAAMSSEEEDDRQRRLLGIFMRAEIKLHRIGLYNHNVASSELCGLCRQRTVDPGPVSASVETQRVVFTLSFSFSVAETFRLKQVSVTVCTLQTDTQ